MDRKKKVHDLIEKMANEVLEYIREQALYSDDGWVSSVNIKRTLDLNFVCVPKSNKQYGKKGWLLAILVRMLEDKEKIEYKKIGNRAFYRSK
jgi:hypothetical protein